MNQEILNKLKHASELSPGEHDGSYELVRTIVSAYRDVDEAVLDYRAIARGAGVTRHTAAKWYEMMREMLGRAS